MVLMMSLYRGVYWLCIIFSAIIVNYNIGIYITPVLLFIITSLTIMTIPLEIAWHNRGYGGLILKTLFI
jgi:hypothetical protein